MSIVIALIDSSVPSLYGRVPFSFIRQGDNPFTGRIINCSCPLETCVDALVSYSRFECTVLRAYRVPLSFIR